MLRLLTSLSLVCVLSPLKAGEPIPFFYERLPFWPNGETTRSLVVVVNEGNPLVEYRVTFDATWSSATHTILPGNPHFSPPIGGAHNEEVVFWQEGELASPGIKNVAEIGSVGLMRNEVIDAIEAGTAREVIQGVGIGSPDSTVMNFTVNRHHPLVTLVTMIAPSPDWFVGVAGVSLCENGLWLDEVVVPLYPYDAGTDSGINFTSPNEATLPPENIFTIVTSPFLVDQTVPPLGTYTFQRVE